MLWTMGTEEGWERLRRAIQEERDRRGLDTLAAFIRFAGIAERTARNVERGEASSPGTLRKLERAFGWPPRTGDRILRGESVTPAKLSNELDELREIASGYTDPTIREFFLKRLEEVRRNQARELEELRQSMNDATT